MKTVTTGNYSRIAFVLAALGAFYFYRRSGGSVSALLTQGRDLVSSGRDMIGRVAPGMNASHSAAPSATI